MLSKLSLGVVSCCLRKEESGRGRGEEDAHCCHFDETSRGLAMLSLDWPAG